MVMFEFILEQNPIAAHCAQNHLLMLKIWKSIFKFTRAKNPTNVLCVPNHLHAQLTWDVILEPMAARNLVNCDECCCSFTQFVHLQRHQANTWGWKMFEIEMRVMKLFHHDKKLMLMYSGRMLKKCIFIMF
jgi:hypothetical protein